MNLNKLEKVGSVIIHQLIIVLIVFFILDYLNIYNVKIYLNLEIFSLMVAALIYVFFKKINYIYTFIFLSLFAFSVYNSLSKIMFLMPLVSSILLLFKEKEHINDYRIFIRRSLELLIVIYLLLLVYNQFVQVSFINLDYYLIGVLILGTVSVIKEPKYTEKSTHNNSIFFAVFLAILGGVIILFLTHSLGLISYIISIISTVLILLLSIAISRENEE